MSAVKARVIDGERLTTAIDEAVNYTIGVAAVVALCGLLFTRL
jgi:hypothetical protein